MCNLFCIILISLLVTGCDFSTKVVNRINGEDDDEFEVIYHEQCDDCRNKPK